MHKEFDADAIEKKWRAQWEADRLYEVSERDARKEKAYVLVEWPYPSGNLHVGHWYAFAVPDIYVRYLRMCGKQVLYPMGFDAFGLPAENAAIKHGVDPRGWTEQNIEHMREQLQSMGASFAWNVSTSSTDPEYYRWTQWMFTRFFSAGIAYRGSGVVNWCPSCHTVIANEQVMTLGGQDVCERCKTAIEKRDMPQWMLRITDYADRLVDDLDNLDWPEYIKEAQRQWIGRSKGAVIDFTLSAGAQVPCFTTRPDTLFGATYLVLAPEHPQVAEMENTIQNWAEVSAYVEAARQADEQDRLDATREKTGVRLEGVTATNPATGEDMPVYVADYVLAHYGTGAIMAVPAHDERDHAFAVAHDLPIRSVVAPAPVTHAGALLEVSGKPGTFLFQKRDGNCANLPHKISFFGGGIEAGESIREALRRELMEELEYELDDSEIGNTYVTPGVDPNKCVHVTHVRGVAPEGLVLHEGAAIMPMTLDEARQHPDIASSSKVLLDAIQTNATVDAADGIVHSSGTHDGKTSEAARRSITEEVGGRIEHTYRLRDWSIGRQRYWGTPIPIVYDPDGVPHPVPEEHLPWTLPEDVDFTPTGEPPLAKSAALRARTEEIFGQGWTPEVETMDTFVDSSWYFLRYLDPHNASAPVSADAQNQWMPIDVYFGGAEHTTMHLLYSRFWQKVLYDLGVATHPEPYAKRINRGLILGPDGDKMSKSKGNIIDPDQEVARVGADAVKMYLAFMGPYEGSNYPWDPGGVVGIRRFLERVNGLSDHITEQPVDEAVRTLHKTIAKLRQDIPQYKFNTAISALMVAVNTFERTGLSAADYETFLLLLAPFAPHLAEELWAGRGHTTSIHTTTFPEYEASYLHDAVVTIGVQIDGKVRGEITLAPDALEEDALSAVRANEALVPRLASGIEKVIYRPGKILNVITKK